MQHNTHFRVIKFNVVLVIFIKFIRVEIKYNRFAQTEKITIEYLLNNSTINTDSVPSIYFVNEPVHWSLESQKKRVPLPTRTLTPTFYLYLFSFTYTFVFSLII